MDVIAASGLHSIKGYFNPEWQNPGVSQQIQEQLSNGRLIVIRNAFRDSFADRIYECLDGYPDWKIYADYKDQFHYRHHNIYVDESYPDDLKWCRQIFGSPSAKQWISRLSQKDCSGVTQLSASWYMPGDHSLPHNDRVEIGENIYRHVAFIWHLTRDWQTNWGGDLFWCPTNSFISPSLQHVDPVCC